MRFLKSAAFGFAAISVVGCNTDMWVQTKSAPLSESELFGDRAASRPLVMGTVPRGHLREDGAFYTGIVNKQWVDQIPLPVNAELLRRGQDRFDIYCSPCHGRIGDGKGMIAQRGFNVQRPIGNYHTDRLRKMPVGHYYDVITNGYGAMYSYASRVEPQDRWAIVAYIKALQLSQHASVNDLNATQKEQLNKPAEPAKTQGAAH